MKVWTVYTYVHINNSDVLYIFVIKFSFINCCLQLVLESVNPAVVFRYSGSEGAWPQMFLLILDLWIWTSAETHWPILKLGDAAFNVCESCCFFLCVISSGVAHVVIRSSDGFDSRTLHCWVATWASRLHTHVPSASEVTARMALHRFD